MFEKEVLIKQIEQEAAIFKSAKAKYMASHLYEFNETVMAWPDIAPFHKELCAFVEKPEPRKKLMLLPRGHLKSSVITVGYSLQQIAKNPGVRILIANATYQMSKTFLSQIKSHLTKNVVFRDLYGDFSKGADKWSESGITVFSPNEAYLEKKEPTVTVFGVGGNLVGQHYDLIILDDIVNRENISTKEQLEKVILFYKDCLDLLEPTGKLLVIGTRWHFADLYGWIMESPEISRDFDQMIRQAYVGEWGRGDILFPQKFTWPVLDELKRQKGSYEFSSQYMNNPVEDETAIFQRKWLKYYEDIDTRGIKYNYFTTIDPAISAEKEADYSAIVTIGVDKYNNWFLCDIIREHLNPLQLINKIFEVYIRFYPISIGIEEEAFQKTLRYFIEEESRKRNCFIPLKELKLDNRISKDMRIRALQPRYEAGSIFHKKALAHIDDLEDELLRFPRGAHDDIIDALAYQLQLALPVKERVSEKHNRYLY